ncbi:DUF3147 family protein [Acinetobacter larvae]|uniref:DUF3147 family protein n=1 Tax=Acinetobacter larvae TaxID=1789224 RepID=A0A1B2LY73_9GAMM|nr:DUF3147 family protein [Acinetobacter larvae]AOA57897.1 hypothetical protein BFG52_05715 [Acinetobacter larvae]
MIHVIIKYAITAAMVILISEVAKRSDRLGGLLAALPLVTVFVLIWMKLEGQSSEKIANHAWYTFWYVVPTLPMFLIFPLLYDRCGFWVALVACCAITVIIFLLWAKLLQGFGVYLI